MTDVVSPVEATLLRIAVPVPLHREFTYRLPSALQGKVRVGMRVSVPFAGRTVAGFVLGPVETAPPGVRRLRDIQGLLEEDALFGDELWSFLLAAAQYCLCPLGEALRAAAPPLPGESVVRLRRSGALADGVSPEGARVAAATQRWVCAVPASELATQAAPQRLSAMQQALWSRLQQAGQLPLKQLQRDLPQALAVARRLAARGLLSLEDRPVVEPFFASPPPPDVRPNANAAQVRALHELRTAIEAQRYAGFLLHGVTGSGKTEVYLRAIAEAQRQGRGALLLVPEIALTPQLVGRFRARFGDGIAVLHSGLSVRQRDQAWRALRAGRLQLAVGARSALFAPVPKLGVLIVDEEHDGSFKQEEGFRYQARDMALLRAERAHAVCILGSATPSMESLHLAELGKLTLLQLPERATTQSLPPVEVVDLRRHRQTPSGHPLLSAPLHRALEQCLQQGQQAILFLNRRGFSPSLLCGACGQLVNCPACSVTLTEHLATASLRCHYCDFTAPVGMPCAACGAHDARRLGTGTERLAQTLAEVFAPARVGRLDRDTVRRDGAEATLQAFRDRQFDILVGTQMVAKGHDIASVTLVGIVLADQSLAFPDFRASERTFQLLSQVAGRAGRGDLPGRVVLQTFQPDHPAIVAAQAHDFQQFSQRELQDRRELGYPPFSRLVAVRIDAEDEAVARRVADELAALAQALANATHHHAVQVLGPAPAPLARLRGRYRFRLLLRSAETRALRSIARRLQQRLEAGVAPARASVDIDPVSML